MTPNALTKTWTPDLQAEYEERAAIREYEAKMTRTNAELAAYREVLKDNPKLRKL